MTQAIKARNQQLNTLAGQVTWSIFMTLFVAINGYSATCQIMNSNGDPQKGLQDALYKILSQSDDCPTSSKTFRRELITQGMNLHPTMVANRGFHNPAVGSFSLFESVTGFIGDQPVEDDQLVFGHFIGGTNGQLDLIDGRGLLVEVIAWDTQRKLYNFYELIGLSSTLKRWIYRGNSEDIFADLKSLHLVDGGEFGNTLRCSGCHMNGGLIMKELEPPHNDWWTKARGLPLGDWQLSSDLEQIMLTLNDPDHLAALVKKSTDRLLTGRKIEVNKLDRQQQLKPLFCSVEINLQSATHHLNSQQVEFIIPADFFVDPWWQVEPDIELSSTEYYAALTTKDSFFPENGLIDADHAWLTPVRSWADTQALVTMVQQDESITEEFIADVLAVDFTNPLFSEKRCALLRFVPQQSEHWLTEFTQTLSMQRSSSAKQLFQHLTEDAYSAASHRQKVHAFLENCTSETNTAEWLDVLGQRRDAVFNSVISSHPGGQILEPGFRIVFPKFKTPKQIKTFDRDCQVN